MTQTIQNQPGWQQPDTDPKASAKAAKAYAKATRPWFKKKRWWLAAAIIVMVGASTTSGGGADSTPTGTDSSVSQSNDKGTSGKEQTKAAPTTVTEVEEEAAPAETASQENARRSAEDYISMTPFSHEGLIKQLEFEGYSTKDAAYGVDSLGANWNEQAAKSGEDYLDMSAFSRQGLIDQLEFEGYTPKQAAYGATQNGL